MYDSTAAPSLTSRPALRSSFEVNVEIATSPLSRIVRLALIGIGTAFAWIIVSLFLGFGLGQAHADEADDDGLLRGALGAVVSVVDATASSVTGTVSSVTTGVTEVVNTVVSVAPAPVRQPVSQAVQSVGAVVSAVTQPVDEVASGRIVSGITAPVVGLVTAVPIVGGIVSGIGLDGAVTDLGGVVDDTLSGVVDVVDDTGSTLGQPPAAAGSPFPGEPTDTTTNDDAALDWATDAASPSTIEESAAIRRGPWSEASALVSSATPDVIVASAAPSGGGVLSSEGGLCLPAGSSAGPGGAGSGASALATLGPLAALSVWMSRAAPEDENAPAAPVGSTDVSPD